MMIDADSDVVSFAEIVLRLPHKSRKREESRQYEFYIHFLPKHLCTKNDATTYWNMSRTVKYGLMPSA